jgi:hypothetical protein
MSSRSARSLADTGHAPCLRSLPPGNGKRPKFKVKRSNSNRLHGWLFVAVSILALLPVGGANPVADSSIFSDEIIARIDDGDFVHPAFSPDGKRLAYANVVVRDKTELAEVYVREISSGKTWRLLDATTSARYATYKAFVYRLVWISNNRLVASISDGDVDSTFVEFDVDARRIVEDRANDGEGARTTEIDRQIQSVKTLPSWEPALVRNAFENGVDLQNGSFLIQPFYADVTPDVFHITPQGQLTQLTRLPETSVSALCGAVQLNDTILFMLSESRLGNSRSADLLRYQDGQVEKLGSIATMTEPELKPLNVDHRRALFFVTTGYSYQRSPGALYAYSSAELREWSAPGPLHDVVGANANDLLALVFWENDRRVIEVRELL